MGVTLKEFYKQMYQKNSKGDWQEFANQAVKLHWVDHVVEVIQEESILKKPTNIPLRLKAFYNQSLTNPSSTQNNITLPKLKPFDMYFLYNRHKHYLW